MRVLRLLMTVAAILSVGCRRDTDEDAVHSVRASGDGSAEGSATDGAGDAAIVPLGLTVSALPGGTGGLELIALTLRKGRAGAELYAAVRNEGDRPACTAALSVELFDRAGQSLAAGVGGLLTQRLYRLTDGSGAIAACAGPGDVAMAAVTDLPSDVALEDVSHVVYRCPHFALDVVPIEGLGIDRLKSVPRKAGTAYEGTLVNALEVAVSQPAVTVFAVNRAGRPLGTAIARGANDIPPGGRWAFQTSTVDAPAVGHVAYPTGAIADETTP